MTRATLIAGAALCLLLGTISGCGDDGDGGGGGETPSDTTAGPEDTTAGPEDTGPAADAAEPIADGGVCEAAATCIQPGRICVYAKVGDTERTCVDATQNVWDDGSDPAKALVTAGNGWVRKRVDNWEDDDVRCNDGSPYGYYISPGNGEAANNWVFFFKGGSGCFDEESCAIRWLTHPQYMRQWRSSSPNYNPTLGAKDAANADINMGIYSRKQETNHFRDWTYVHFHYCSSDSFSGTALPPDNPVGLYHRGNAMVHAVVADLTGGVDASALGVDVPLLENAKQVLVAGGSAGATGSRRNMDRMASLIKSVAPAALVRGMGDSAFSPPIYPGHFDLALKDAVAAYLGGTDTRDADCLEAHADEPGLCSDPAHVASGGGIGAYHGAADDGHLGVAATTEKAGVEGVFIFMAQWDGKARSGARLLSACVERECTTHADCGAGRGCQSGVCWRTEPCTPAYCTPDDEPCYGQAAPPACLNGFATHASGCDVDEDCASGLLCAAGMCAERKYLGCESVDECPAGFSCSRGICLKSVEDSTQCKEPGYGWVKDTNTCEQSLGCNAARPCGDGFVCLHHEQTPFGSAFSWGIRYELSALGPGSGAFAPDNATHTASSGSKFYAFIEDGDTGDYKAQPSLRVQGVTFAEALGQWFADPASYTDLISPPPRVVVPLWASEITGLDAPGLQAALTTTCDNALGVGICAADGECTPASALFTLVAGNSGVQAAPGATPAGPVPLRLVVAAHPSCTDVVLTLPAGASLGLTYRYGPAATDTTTLALGLPPGTIDASALPLALYIGADGATYLDAELTALAAKGAP